MPSSSECLLHANQMADFFVISQVNCVPQSEWISCGILHLEKMLIKASATLSAVTEGNGTASR